MTHEVGEGETCPAKSKVSKTISHVAALTRAKFCKSHSTGLKGRTCHGNATQGQWKKTLQ